jgi:2-keto-4-pentenoate hydratase/2-oxohepta-3-ene-1,7-dioic acid hydratase in catechol pathway
MRLLRYGPAGREKPALLGPDNMVRDLSAVIADIDHENLGADAMAHIRNLDPAELPEVSAVERIGPCVARPGKLVCIGLNYSDHAAEAGMNAPNEPIVFMKATSSIVGPNDVVRLPPGSQKTDWEVELAVVIGRAARYIGESVARSHIAGYCLFNDISERHYQLERGGQWVKGKSADTFGPLGPYLVTPDEVPDPQNLRLMLDVNGQRFQDGTTANMIFGIDYLISYVSHFMALLPGDVIATGTPAGVGMGQKPPHYLKQGDRMRLEIPGLGVQEQEVKPTIDKSSAA